MKKFNKTDRGEKYIIFGGVEYAFIVLENNIGIRRVDEKIPKEGAVDKLTEYLIAEGFAEHLVDKENDIY